MTTTEQIAARASALLAGLVSDPGGQVSPSVYETGRVVTLAPWLTGHDRRLAYLLDTQHPDGTWGAPGGYALVPTLSATEALLTTAIGPGYADARPEPDLAHAADRGLRALFRLLPGLDAADVPDTPAADLIAVALIDAINAHLDRLAAGDRPPALDAWSDGARLRPPAGFDGSRNAKIQAALAAGAPLPDKLLHALEVASPAARGARTVRPTPIGTTPSATVGASPAATAAWLDGPGDPAARRFLEDVVDRHGGPVPCGYPITVFERGWVLTTLARAGLATAVPGDLTASLRAALGPYGTPAGEGLPADADTSSVALYALGLLGDPVRPDALWQYRTETHFCTWPGEDGFSVTTNAHVLEAIGQYATRPAAEPSYAATAAELAGLLRAHQRPDGSWYDRWHASPYYATACCALALHRFGGPASRTATAAAAAWLLDAQRPDGAWGRWTGTVEETAYAVQVLALTGTGGTAIARGRAYLLEHQDDDSPPLWHDKDLYRPAAIVRAAVLAALRLSEHAP